MIYDIENIRLLKVAETKKNAGSLYLKFEVVDPENPIDNGEVTVLDERFVSRYAKYLNIASPDGVDQFGQPKYKESLLLDTNKPLPEAMLKTKYTQFEQYITPGGEVYVRVDDDDQPVRNEKGNFITTTSLWVFTWKKVDNQTGEMGYVKGWDPISRGKSILDAFYKPLKEFTANENTGVVLPQGAEAPLINGESAPAAAPAV